MSQYDRQIALAQRMIAKRGQSVIWRKQTAAPVDPTKPWKSAAADGPTEYSCTILFLRPSGGLARALFHLIKGTDAPSGAPRGLMAAQSFTPDMKDSVVRNGSVLVVDSFEIVAPDGTPILYDIEFA